MDGARNMSSERFQVITPSNPDYRNLLRGLTKEVWPEFMLHDTVANENWHELLDRFADYQVALYDAEKDRVAGIGSSFPLHWDDKLENLPEEGWDWAFEEAVRNHKESIAPNFHCAIQIVLRHEYQGHGLSRPMVDAVRSVTKSKGLMALIIPLRPSEKHRYPLISLDDYITWKDDENEPFDPWLRVHIRAGARIIKVCHQSKLIRGTRAEWEQWTGMKFSQTGAYIVRGALSPVDVDIEKNEGVYVEPNVWIVHQVR
jgi:GNAT superfamily N-acetyltransferase